MRVRASCVRAACESGSDALKETREKFLVSDDHGAAVRDLDRLRERFKRRAASSTVS